MSNKIETTSEESSMIQIGAPRHKRQMPEWLISFYISFLVAFLTIIPFVIQGHGSFALICDFNAQSIPYGIFMSESVHTGELLWNWGIDLGGNFLESFNYYAFGSPFAVLSFLFPSKWFPFVMPWILMLKFAVAGLTSSLYFKRYIFQRRNIIIASLLYAFSGFQCASVMFYHFQDMVALFPLMLVGLEKLVEEKETGYFAVACAVNALCNCVFFVGEVIFVVLYYVVKYVMPNISTMTSKKSLIMMAKSVFQCMIEGILGMITAAVLLLPSIINILSNGRANSHIEPQNWFTISTTDILCLLKAAIFPADIQNNAASVLADNWMSNAVYLPLFGLLFVIAYAITKKDWLSNFLKISLVISLVKVFNNSFMMFNSSSYRRWFYMLAIVMALATAKVLENTKEYRIKKSLIICFLCIFFLIGMTVLLPENAVFDLPKYIFQILVACTGLVLAWAIALGKISKMQIVYTAGYCVLVLGVNLYGYQHGIDNTGIDFHEGKLSYSQNVVSYLTEIPDALQADILPYRYYFDEGIGYTYYNFSAVNSLPSTNSFTSTPHAGVLEFYDSLGIPRNTNTVEGPEGMQELLSVKYIVSRTKQEGYTYVKTIQTSSGEEMYVYEIENALPIGICYQEYMLKSEFEKLPPEIRAIAMLYAVIVDDDDEGMVQNILKKSSGEFDSEMWHGQLEKLGACASQEFIKKKNSFEATIVSPKEQVAFFSVPYDKYWKATVNGEAVEILDSNGMMIIPVKEGENSIVFKYEYTPVIVGGVLSLCGVASIFAYIIVTRKNYLKLE